MRATSLSINLRQPCNARCPFCISRTTCKPGIDGERHNERLLQALPVAFRYINTLGVTTILVTSSGEPLIDAVMVRDIIQKARRCAPLVELQTNGSELGNIYNGTSDSILDALVGVRGLSPDMEERPTHIAISAAAMDPGQSQEIMGLPSAYDYLRTASKVAASGVVCRVTLNMIQGAFDPEALPDYADRLHALGVRQLTLRELDVEKAGPASTTKAKVNRWVRENALDDVDVHRVRGHIEAKGSKGYRLPHGPWVYAYRGLAVTVATCGVTDEPTEDVRSLVLQPDGHVHPGWRECVIL